MSQAHQPFLWGSMCRLAMSPRLASSVVTAIVSGEEEKGNVEESLPDEVSVMPSGHTTSPRTPLEGAKFRRGSSALRRHSIAHPLTGGLISDRSRLCTN